MENIHKNIGSISDIYLEMWEFSNFCTNIHNAVGCQKPHFRHKTYCDVLP